MRSSTVLPRQRQGVARRAVVALLAGSVVAVYACSDGTAPESNARASRLATGPNATVTPGVVTLCKVGPGASFGVQVGLAAAFQSLIVQEGGCATLPKIAAAPGDDVIVTIREDAAPYYALNRIVLAHGENTPQTITGTNSVSFEGIHGANVTFYNDGVVRLCKEGTNASFEYEIGLGAGFQALSLTNGECRNLAQIPPVYPDDMVVTIRENTSPTYRLNHITFTHGDLTPVTITNQNQLGFEGSHGAVVVFHNDPVAAAGCTYTQGWYKNKGSGQLPVGNFYSSGQSWLSVLDTEPKGGNAYYILAHQFIAATLNAQSASVPADVSAALTAATTYFGLAAPNDWSAGGRYTKPQLTRWADVLAAYNEGTIGPGHCN